MALPKSQKRSTNQSYRPSKKRKLNSSATSTGKRAADRGYISIPNVVVDGGDDVSLSEQDLDFLEEYDAAGGFLQNLDMNGISRSKKETDRLHKLSKPPPQKTPLKSKDGFLSSGTSEDDDDETSGSDSDIQSRGSVLDSDISSEANTESDSDEERSFERLARPRRPSWYEDDGSRVEGLPIKLPDGRIQRTTTRVLPEKTRFSDESDEEKSAGEENAPNHSVEDVATGARFGRASVADVVGIHPRTLRIQTAKEQIASICQDIVAEPENSLGLLKRLHTFALSKIVSPSHPEPVTNDILIRKLAFLSQLVVFKDVIPSYRIRALTDTEKAEKVSQMVMRSREWEQGLVNSYQQYLRLLDAELKEKSELAEVALRCMCDLLVTATHFNFRSNIMGSIVARLSKKSWDKSSDLCLQSIVSVFRADLTGQPSLELVRFINRMVKDRHYKVHPAVFSCLLHLRLRTESSVRASDSRADKEAQAKQPWNKNNSRRAKGKTADHLSKKARKADKAKKEIEEEMREAEAEVNKEERASTHTETLKLLFVLYFSILKNPRPTPLLPMALQGLSLYAHLVNVDFFKDLLKVLKDLVTQTPTGDGDEEDEGDDMSINIGAQRMVAYRLQCISAAFELLSGQGEALNIDLSDFIIQLYALLPSLAFLSDVETVQNSGTTASSSLSTVSHLKPQSLADMLFRALHLIFPTRAVASTTPPWRAAAFAKRLLSASLHWPTPTVLRTLNFVGILIANEPRLDALLSADDRAVNGIYRPDIDDPQLCNPFGTSFWELRVLEAGHVDRAVREAARRILSFSRS